jgi:hypothetical protein
MMDIWFNPKSVMDKVQDLEEDELPFINAKIDNAHIDFEDTGVDDETTFDAHARNMVRGRVTDQPTNQSSTFSMMWETGKAGKQLNEMNYCNYDQSECYEAKTVPVINGVSANTGYTSGGQNLTISGFGFEDSRIAVTVDGVACLVTQNEREQFSCTI